MSSASFGAQTQALTTASSAFDAEYQPITEQAARLENVEGSSSTTGRDYGAQGNAYRQALTGPVQALISDFAQMCEWTSASLDASSSSYQDTDQQRSADLSASGAG